MDKNKIKLIIEIVLFICGLGLITFAYYFLGNDVPEEDTEEEVGIVKVTDENFEEEVLNSDKPVVLEFFSNSCPPCLTMIPTMIDIAKNNKDIKVANVNGSEENTTNISQKYEIQAFPTIIIFKNGEVQKTFVGATKEEDILKELKQ